MSDEKDKKNSSVSEQIQSSFLSNRKIFLWGEVSDKSARDLTEKLLFLEDNDAGKEITFYINSPGGSITAGMAIFDTMQLITSPIKVVVTEWLPAWVRYYCVVQQKVNGFSTRILGSSSINR